MDVASILNMKNIIFILVFITSLIGFSQKNVLVTYKKISNLDESEITIPRIKSIIQSLEEVEYELFISDSLAVFKKKDKVYSDKFNKSALVFGGGSTKHFFSEENYFYNEENINNKKYFIKDIIDQESWVVKNETKIINNYKCYKAEKKTKIQNISIDKDKMSVYPKTVNVILEAWFCPELPYNYGPDIFYGLPGLVFEGYQTNGKVKYTLTSIKFDIKDLKITIPENNIISKEESFRLLNDFLKNKFE
jgi:GLPGLI family protein